MFEDTEAPQALLLVAAVVGATAVGAAQALGAGAHALVEAEVGAGVAQALAVAEAGVEEPQALLVDVAGAPQASVSNEDIEPEPFPWLLFWARGRDAGVGDVGAGAPKSKRSPRLEGAGAGVGFAGAGLKKPLESCGAAAGVFFMPAVRFANGLGFCAGGGGEEAPKESPKKESFIPEKLEDWRWCCW